MKDSRKPEIRGHLKLNFKDYDYMDGLFLRAWIWEFVRRNQSYKQICEELSKKPVAQIVSRKLATLREDFAIAPLIDAADNPDNVNTNHFLKIQEDAASGEDLWIPRPEISYLEFHRNYPFSVGPHIIGATPVKYVDIDDLPISGDVVPPDVSFKLINESLCISRPIDTLYFGIATEASKAEVLDYLEYYVDSMVLPRSVKILPEWKMYLFIFDLLNLYKQAYPEASYGQFLKEFTQKYAFFYLVKDYDSVKRDLKKLMGISSSGRVSDEVFKQAFNKATAPSEILEIFKIRKEKKVRIKFDSSEYFDENKCRRYYESAQALIDGGFKEYLY